MAIIENKDDYKRRIIDDLIEVYLEIAGAICIEGPKWCGKTWTSAYHCKSEFLIGDPLNNFNNREIAKIDPVSILQGETPRIIDEWQEIPSVWDAVRSEVDKRHKKGQFILTGSSTPKNKGIMHSGAGRIVSIKMNTMTLFETKNSSGDVSLKELCEGTINTKLQKNVTLDELAYFIVRGGWPENIDVKKDLAHLMSKSYMNNIINEDLNKIDDGIYYDKHKVYLLLKSLARNESTTVSESFLLKDIIQNDNESISRNTISKYLDVLDRMFLFNNVPPFSPNLRSSLRVKQMEKRHFADPAMACAMLDITIDKLMNDLNTFGFMFEALVEHDLTIYAQAIGAKLYHYQDYKDNEIDAIIELNSGEWCAFEIKLGSNRIEEGAKNLIKVCQSIENNGYKKPKIMGVICGVCNAFYKREDNVYVIPFTSLKD